LSVSAHVAPGAASGALPPPGAATVALLPSGHVTVAVPSPLSTTLHEPVAAEASDCGAGGTVTALPSHVMMDAPLSPSVTTQAERSSPEQAQASPPHSAIQYPRLTGIVLSSSAVRRR
jgi:hypothetical protein